MGRGISSRGGRVRREKQRQKDGGKKIRILQELTERRGAGIFGGRKTEPDHAVNPAGCFYFSAAFYKQETPLGFGDSRA
jgi:hypothetical protein